MKTMHTRILACFGIAITLMLTACGQQVATKNDVNQLNSRLDTLSAQVKQLLPKAATKASPPATGPNSVAVTAPATTTTTEDPIIARMNHADTLSVTECEHTDMYIELGLTDPRVDQYGGSFYYDCPSHMWGWFLMGTSADKWKTPSINTSGLAVGEQRKYPITALGAPGNRRNPASPQALTLAELKPGMVVCQRNIDVPRSLHVTELFTVVSQYSDENLVYGAYGTDNVDDQQFNPLSGFELEKMGVIPTEFGRWFDDYLTAGHCS